MVTKLFDVVLLHGAALNIRILQQRWMIFNSFQMTKDGRTPFILKMIGIDVLF